jgi:TPR repeat protein
MSSRQNNGNIFYGLSLALLMALLIFALPLTAAGQAEDPGSLQALLAQAEAGDAQAMYQVGRLYETGSNAPRNLSLALDWYKKAGEAGAPAGWRQAGLAYEIGKGVAADRSRAMEYLRRAAEAGLKDAAYSLVSLTLAGPGPGPLDIQSALNILLGAGETEARAWMTLGAFYENGLGLSPNYSRALGWYGKAAELGLAEAFYSLGVSYEIGLGAAVDPGQALANFQKAADLKLAAAAYKLAELHLNGLLIPPDHGKAVAYLRQAVADGHAEAANELGVIHLEGMLDQPRDLDLAFGMFVKSAELGNAEAMKNVAVIFRGGLGRPPDQVQALRWYLTAQAAGYQNPGFKDLLPEVRKGLRPRDIKRAEEEAEAWLAEFKNH